MIRLRSQGVTKKLIKHTMTDYFLTVDIGEVRNMHSHVVASLYPLRQSEEPQHSEGAGSGKEDDWVSRHQQFSAIQCYIPK
jgi:hypothetical protein